MASITQIVRRRRNRRQRRTSTRNQRQSWLVFAALIISILVLVPISIAFGSVFITYARALERLPLPQETINRDPIIGATQFYDSDGQSLLFSIEDPLGDQRTWINIDDLPDYIVDATILWEDGDFLTTFNSNLLDMTGKLWSNTLNGPASADTSLTGRLVRNVILPQSDFVTVDDRALEIALISEIEQRYTPEEIIEWHLNTNYYGSEAYGIDAAAQVYLGKSAVELTLDEAALLVAIPTAPQFNPVDNETAARARQSDMLRRLLAEGYIGASSFEAAINVNTTIRANAGQTPLIAPDFAQFARRQAETILTSMGLNGPELVSRGGLRITTTLDTTLYYQAECVLRAHVQQLETGSIPQLTALDGGPCDSASYLLQTPPLTLPPDTGTLVILDVQTGQLKAMVGPGNRYEYQPGPVLYPFVYLDGFLNSNPNYTGATMLLDIPRDFPGRQEQLLYIPSNPDDRFLGPISLRDAMGAGIRVPAMQVANTLNLNNVLRDTLIPMGITSLQDQLYHLSLLAEGGLGSVLEIAHAYSVFAALGDAYGLPVINDQGVSIHQPVAVARIETPTGEILWDYNADQVALNVKPVLDESIAYIVNHILADAGTRRTTLGADTPLEAPRRTAVVYGQTANQEDNWTVGYTPRFVVAAHVSRRDGGPTSIEGYGDDGAGPIWRALMDYLYVRDELSGSDWQRPISIVETPVCMTSGLSPNGICNTRPELFLDVSQIPPQDTYWIKVEVNSQTGQRATFNTAAALRDERVYFNPPQEALNWWVANNRPLPPIDYDIVSGPDLLSSAVILQPRNLEIVGGVVDVRGSISEQTLNSFQLRFGRGPNPSSWTDIGGPQTEYTDGTSLGSWNTTSLENGTYVLQLSVVRNDGQLDQPAVQVVVDNESPAVILFAGEPGQIFRWGEDPVIPLRAEVVDNIGVQRVEFYRNGQIVGTRTDFPYGYDHEITRAGIEEFVAVAFDSVGNSTSTAITVEVIRSE